MATTVPDSSLASLLAPGKLFENKYRILGQLGTGSFAVVVKARHEVMGRDVALKCLKPSVVRANPEVSERFVNEVRIVSRLRHPNTVTIFDFGGSAHGLAYMVLEYLQGETLDELIARDGPMEEPRALHICRQILKSLDEAHAQGIVHRDLKPSNIMLTELHGEPDFVKVLDFGVAKLLSESNSRRASQAPRSTQFIGTPIYMSPEQVLGQSVTPASDIYSLGLLLYQMLTAQTPIPHESVAAVIREHLEPGPLPLHGLERLSAPMQALILTATRRAPSERFQSVADFLSALPLNPADLSSEQLRVAVTARRDALSGAALSPGLAEESSEPDVFSGKNYIEVPDPAPAPTQRTQRLAPSGFSESAAARPVSARMRVADSAQGLQPRLATPVPSLRTDELDLDLEALDRQRRQAEHKRRRPTPSHSTMKLQRAPSRPGDLLALEPGGRADPHARPFLLLGALICAYWSFLLLGAMLHTQPTSTRWMVSLFGLLAPILASRFSGTRIVNAGLWRRWLIPACRNTLAFSLLLTIAGLVGWPTQAAQGLQQSPTWFLQAFPAAPPFSWLAALTTPAAHAMAGVFGYAAALMQSLF